MSEPEERFDGVIDLKSALPDNEPGTVAGIELWFPGPSESQSSPHHVLFAHADHYEKAELLSKCSLPMGEINLDSENLEHKESFVFLGPQDDAIYIPLWYAKCLRVSEQRNTVRIVFIGSDWAVDMRHQLTGDDLDGFMVGCMALMNSSGPNCNAHRADPKEAIEAVTDGAPALRYRGNWLGFIPPNPLPPDWLGPATRYVAGPFRSTEREGV